MGDWAEKPTVCISGQGWTWLWNTFLGFVFFVWKGQSSCAFLFPETILMYVTYKETLKVWERQIE